MSRKIQACVHAAVLVVVFQIAGGRAAAAPIVLDQENPAVMNTTFALVQDRVWEQGVVAGVTGALTGFDVFFVSTGTVEVFVNLGAPWQSDVSQYVANVNVVSGWNSILLPVPIYMLVNTDFVIGIKGTQATGPGFRGASTNGYGSGSIYLDQAGDPFANGSYDMAFKTFVDTGADAPGGPAVPEPASLTLLGLGLAAIGRSIRRRRAA